MKKLLLTGLLAIAMLSITNAQYVAERTGYEGDYFSLEGALDLFKDSKTINQFERRLNRESNWVNNLDLNFDGKIDYIRVEHKRQGSFHAIIMQAVVSRYELQDVAVIEIEKVSRFDAVVQIVGDADLYGEEVIVESQLENVSNARNVSYRGYDNAYYWAPIQYIYAPRYVVYVSPYRWSYYPSWWSPWNPCGWNVYYPRVRNYYRNYHIVNVHRVVNVHNYYYPSRNSCNRVAVRARQVRKTHGHSAGYRNVRKKNDTNFVRSNGGQRTSATSRTNNRTRTNNSRSTINSRPGNGNHISTGKNPTRTRATAKPYTGRNTSRAGNTNVSKPTRSSSGSSSRRPAVSKKPTRSAGSGNISRSSSRSSSASSSRRPSVSKKPTRSAGSGSYSRSSSSSRNSSASSSRRPSVSKKPTRSSSSYSKPSSSRRSAAKPAPRSKPAPRASSSSSRSKSPSRASSSVSRKPSTSSSRSTGAKRSAPSKKSSKRG